MRVPYNTIAIYWIIRKRKKTKQNNEKINKMKVEIESNRMVANRKWQCERITFDVSESFATKWNAVWYGNCTLDTCSIFQWRKLQLIEWVSVRASEWASKRVEESVYTLHKSWLGHCDVQCVYIECWHYWNRRNLPPISFHLNPHHAIPFLHFIPMFFFFISKKAKRREKLHLLLHNNPHRVPFSISFRYVCLCFWNLYVAVVGSLRFFTLLAVNCRQRARQSNSFKKRNYFMCAMELCVYSP